MYNHDFEMLQEHGIETDDKQYCDECGIPLKFRSHWFPVEKLKRSCANANKGESATFCPTCYEEYEK